MIQAKSASETIVDCLVICLEMLSPVAEILPLGSRFLMVTGEMATGRQWDC